MDSRISLRSLRRRTERQTKQQKRVDEEEVKLELQAACEGGRPPNTYTGTNTSGTRIDYALMNRAAASAFVACETIGVGSVRGHRCVRIRLAVQAFEQQTWRFNVPRAIPVKPAGRVVEVPRLDAVCAAAREGDVEGAWMALSAMCEQYLLDRSGMPACERRAHTGRGNSELKMTRVAARSTPDRGVACETELRHGNAIRRLEHYVYQRARLEASGLEASGPFQVPQELRLCWLRCLAVIRGGGVGEPPPSDPPSAEVARVYLHDVRLRSARFNAAAARVRKRQQQERQLTMFGTDRRALVSMLRGGPGQAADAVRTADGRLTANVEEMDEVLQEAWDPILRMYGEGRPEPEYEAFRRAFEGFIPRRQMDLRDVTGSELRDVLNKRKKKTTACGVDGWRLDELKALPDELLDGFATLFNLVEERGEWPKGMLTSLDGWILPSQHGFRRGHRTDDVLMELTTLIEETLLDESKSLYMVALDFAKCFDRVPQGIVLRLAEEMGLDARILRPLRAVYRGMKRRFKLPLGVGSEFEVTNGILQGCPLSVILINALLSIVLRAVSARVPEVSSESLADDATLFAAAESEVLRRKVWMQLARQRPSYDGVQAGVDCGRTNGLRLTAADGSVRRALTVILSGGVFLAARWGRNARAGEEAAGSEGSASSPASTTASSTTSTASDASGSFDEQAGEDGGSSTGERRPPPDRCCRDCDRHAHDTADHLWWECPAYDEIRRRPCFAELMRADRARWPSCTRVHGVIVEGAPVDAAALHHFMASVYVAREESERGRLAAVQPIHPWRAATSRPAVRHLFDFGRLPDEPPKWPYGGRTMRAMKGWLSALQWTDTGEVSNIELAVDFEVFTGHDILGPPNLAANRRGKTLWTMLATLCRLCRELQLPSPLPAERKDRVGSMRTLGAPMLWGGLTPRPHFAGGEETFEVLEMNFPRAALGDGKNWGGDVFPLYDATRRAQRSARWAEPTPMPQRPRLPVLVPESQADPLLRSQSVWVVLAATAAVATGVAVVVAAAAAAVAAAAAAEAAETTVTETVAAAAAAVAAAHAAAVAAADAAGIAAAAAVAVAA
ncbi:RNA-directed DNA polymerase from mobile element jockey [Diplonema papillatum]|nr:RNA-directed DNA polymerase from mobile element jockey [Diplonema papillatum]